MPTSKSSVSCRRAMPATDHSLRTGFFQFPPALHMLYGSVMNRDSPETPPPDGIERRKTPRWGLRNTAGVSIASSIAFDNVSQDFGSGPVVDQVSFKVEPGKVVCLLGPSGSGKTSLLRLAAGLDAPASGTVSIDGRIVAGPDVLVAPEKRGIGLVFQDYALFPHLTILGNVLFGLAGIDRQLALEQARHMLDRVGLGHLQEAWPHMLSGGEQQRVALARALVRRPGILLMDEPFSGLDARLRDSVREETLSLLREIRATALVVTHDPEEALRIGDHIALLRDGKLVQFGTCEQLYLHPSSLFAAAFFSEINRIDTVVREGAAKTPIGIADAKGFAEGEQVAVCIRLGDVTIEPCNDSSANARITARRFLGVDELLELSVTGQEEPLRARVRHNHANASANGVKVAFRDGAAMVFAAR